MATYNDVIIYDETGCLYMCAECYGIEYLYKDGKIDPSNRETYGTDIKIRAFVDIHKGKPILGRIP